MDPVSELLQTGAVVLGILTVIGPVVLAALDERNRKKFATKSEVCTPDGKVRFQTREDAIGMSQRIDEVLSEHQRQIERNTGLFVGLDDRVADVVQREALLEERQSNQWERISEQMASTARTIEGVASKLEGITRTQQEFALRLEREARKRDGA